MGQHLSEREVRVVLRSPVSPAKMACRDKCRRTGSDRGRWKLLLVGLINPIRLPGNKTLSPKVACLEPTNLVLRRPRVLSRGWSSSGPGLVFGHFLCKSFELAAKRKQHSSAGNRNLRCHFKRGWQCL